MMSEIDHEALNNPHPPPPEPAKPILASHLLELEEKHRERFSERGNGARISTGCSEIDEILGGGCERGIVVGVSAEGGEGRLISLQLLSSLLISHLRPQSQSPTKPKAIIIDTTGSFPVPLLAKVLKSRILATSASSASAAAQSANHAVISQEQAETDLSIEKDVQRCLEMVAISRVFDIEGLCEVLSEVGREETSQDTTAILAKREETNDHRPEVPDSEEELTPEEAIPLPPAQDTGTEILIIDTLTNIITELLARKEKATAHSLINQLSLTLHTLTRQSNILTLLHNTVVPSKTATTPNPHYYTPVPIHPNPRHQNQPQIQLNPSSIFPTSAIKPALGQIFTQFPELHLLLHALPKTRVDAQALYGRVDEPSGNRNTVNYCFVVEVLKDETPNLGFEEGGGQRFGWREQKWTAVEVERDGTRVVGAFQARGNRKEVERERVGGLTDVGNVAKIYGFGGRRV